MSGTNPPNQDPFGIPPSPSQYQVPQSSGKSSGMIIAIVLGGALMVMMMCGGVLLALLLPAVGGARQAAQRMSRSNNIKEIGLGMHNYHAAYNQLPHTVNQNSNGKERTGWRVTLSPFVEGQTIYEQYDEEQAWNSATNEPLSIMPPRAFQAVNGEPGDTNIFVIVDPQGMFPPTPNTKVGFRDVLDGLANTVMAIELPNRTAIWSSNENMTPDEAYAAIQEVTPTEAAHLLMGDGAVRAVTPDLSREMFDALVTRAGGETISSQF